MLPDSTLPIPLLEPPTPPFGQSAQTGNVWTAADQGALFYNCFPGGDPGAHQMESNGGVSNPGGGKGLSLFAALCAFLGKTSFGFRSSEGIPSKWLRCPYSWNHPIDCFWCSQKEEQG